MNGPARDVPGRRLGEHQGRWLLLIATLVAVAHAIAIAPHYRVGSFDDDANYVLVARAIAHGAGLTTTLSSGYPLVVPYPPGYAALLSPLALVFGNALVPYRVLSLALAVVLFPLTWLYLGRRGVGPVPRAAIVALLALNPVLGTYSTMVMAELPFLIALIALLIVVERWERQPEVITRAGLATVVLGASLLWFKEAGIGAVLGLVCWLALKRYWGKAIGVLAGVAALISPVLIARAVAGTSLIGSRYSGEITQVTASGGVVERLHRVWLNIGAYINPALPRSVVPAGLPLGLHGPVGTAWAVTGAVTAPLVAVGFVRWCLHHRDAACLVVPVYLAETLLYPYINERRVILVLPLVVAWYVLGLASVLILVRKAALRSRVAVPRLRTGYAEVTASAVLAVGVPGLVVAPLVFGFRRDYLLARGENTSNPAGAPYLSVLRHLGQPSDVVETDYLWTTALFSGHRTAWGAFMAPCPYPPVILAFGVDHAGFALSAAFNVPRVVDDDCVLSVLSSEPVAVRLYRTRHDLASVFELIGPGTAHPRLVDVTGTTSPAGPAPVEQVADAGQSPSDHPGTYAVTPARGGAAVFRWSFPAQRVRQVSLSAANALSGSTGTVTVSLRDPNGPWRQVATVPGAVGDDGVMPFLLIRPDPAAALATGVQVTVAATGSVALRDLHVLAGS